MDKNIKKINDILVNLFNTVLKMEEASIRDLSSQDISITEIHTLVAIGTGRPRTMTHVANLLGISVSTLTSAINKLVKKGYVERVRDEEDRRIVKIYLSEKGISAVDAHEAFHENMVREAISGVPEEELQRFISSIDQINQFLIMRSAAGSAGKGIFKLTPLKLGAYMLPVPLVQAGMGLGLAGSGLAAAVAAEGGLGLVGTAGMDQEWVRREVKTALSKARKGDGKGLIGVSIMWGEPQTRKYVETAVKAGAQVIVTSAAIPTDLPRYCSSKKVALIPTISSKRAASAIIRSWSQKYNRVPDGFIFQGPLAAGMLGFKEAQLEKAEQEWYRIISDIKAELMKLENCPLIVSGGIMGKTDAEKAYRCGADGYLMGTRFVTTEECGAPEDYKKLYLNCTANDVTIIRSPVKTSVRTMKTALCEKLERDPGQEYDIIEAAAKGVAGDPDNALIFCGAGIEKIRSIDSVKDVFREFTT